jgi:hypothetical protein
MVDKSKMQFTGTVGHSSDCQCGCNSQPQTNPRADEKAAKERLAAEEAIRARNKMVREPSHTHRQDSNPPFTNHSGDL